MHKRKDLARFFPNSVAAMVTMAATVPMSMY